MSNAPASKALATTSPRDLRVTGHSRDADVITQRLQHAAKHYHLVSPATTCAILPEGMSVSTSTVLIDTGSETYDVGGGKLGLAKVALDKIAAAAGISWDARLSGRLDNGSDPHYVAWRAVGRVRHLDGTIVQLVGTKEMDLRVGSAQVEALYERYQDKLAKWKASGRGYEPKAPDGQIREMRLHILAHAESKARLRAIRSLGIRSAYTADELKKPFVVARIMWTGQSEDPELRRMFAMKMADAMLDGERAIYGEPPPAQLPSASGMPTLGRKPPPPVGAAEEADDLDRMESIPAAPTSEPKDVQAPPPAAEPKSAPKPSNGEGPVCRFGKQKDVPLADLDDDDLGWYTKVIKENVEDPKKAKFRTSNEAHYREVLAEHERRNGVPADDGAGDEIDRGPNAEDY